MTLRATLNVLLGCRAHPGTARKDLASAHPYLLNLYRAYKLQQARL